MKKSKSKQIDPNELVATSLRAYANRLLTSENVDVEEARSLDRALRSCKAISDIDCIWVRWSYFGEKNGWITVKELEYNGRNYFYPEKFTIPAGDAYWAWADGIREPEEGNLTHHVCSEIDSNPKKEDKNNE